MDFNIRLKEEIEYNDIRYKELSVKSGVPERALYNYVATKNPSMPPADVAVRIARTLNVSVEYLVDGNKSDYSTHHEQEAFFPQKQINIINAFNKLSPIEQKAVIKLIDTLCEQHEEE